MTLPIDVPVDPMLAKSVPEVPDVGPKGGALSYEPKWDGFRAIVWIDRDGDDNETTVEIGSRGSKLLTRYFPELVAAFRAQFSVPCVIDGEIVVRRGQSGAERLDWEALSQRIHPAATRINRLAVETPAAFIGFDLLALGDQSLLDAPFSVRREALEQLLKDVEAPLHLSQVTTDPEVARRWLVEFEGAGLDGVVAKPLAGVYEEGKRRMLKIKHHRTADVIALGYRIHTSGSGVGSLLVGLRDDSGAVVNVGGVSAFTTKRRLELIDELAPLVARAADGSAETGETERSRFSSGRDTSFVKLEPTRVLEVRYDQMEGARFRHTVQFERWRPDREAESCTFDQLEVPAAYDLGRLLS
jgi:ATP-dependent DNA ligase